MDFEINAKHYFARIIEKKDTPEKVFEEIKAGFDPEMAKRLIERVEELLADV